MNNQGVLALITQTRVGFHRVFADRWRAFFFLPDLENFERYVLDQQSQTKLTLVEAHTPKRCWDGVDQVFQDGRNGGRMAQAWAGTRARWQSDSAGAQAGPRTFGLADGWCCPGGVGGTLSKRN